MKKLLFLVGWLISLNLSAQCISIELSIEYKEELNFDFKELDSINIKPAFLNITYKNDCDRAVYFPRVYMGDGNFPYISKKENIYDLWDMDDSNNSNGKLSYENNANEKYKVYIYGVPDLYSAWGIYKDTVDVYKAKIFDDIHTDINMIHNYIYSNYDPLMEELLDEWGHRQYFHNPNDISSKSIKNNSAKGFVFLKPGEVVKDSFQLIAFQMIGGTFTFHLFIDEPMDYVYIDSQYINFSNFMDYQGASNPVHKLPNKTGKYHLYKKKFLKNDITVYFPGVSAPNNSIRQKE